LAEVTGSICQAIRKGETLQLEQRGKIHATAKWGRVWTMSGPGFSLWIKFTESELILGFYRIYQGFE
jgi:hypothetical protein